MAHKMALTIFLILAYYASQSTDAHPLKICKFDQIYQLGDSISDTGNLIREYPIGANTAFGKLPYGETFFKNATGRCSNGFLMIDYIAMAAGLPLLQPYKNTAADFVHGANFAVAGSTALPSRVLESKKIFNPVTTSSLDVQLDWMSSHFDSICVDHRDCMEKLRHALFMVGEIGGNDYNYAIFQGKSIDELKSMVPDVVNVIMEGVKLNDFATYHNEKLQQAIHKLQQETPNAMIIYGDYYNAYQFLLEFARIYGFDTERACCGIGGKYSFNMTRMCGAPGVEVCSDPHRYMSWDGVHLTQEGYKIMSAWLIHNIFHKFHCHF
ncbi:acetylajmalan esterase-like [Dorcoceras hygrometricum]|uniref:Acetylajmalan esterase-like n=1 Tax=Dorcoceras hygrometricum TaxID=472368 RepID=A0A2Z7CG80_9LAMI|nr:acetylajmalan esterase-like [Dorcoceras hygrometricum]